MAETLAILAISLIVGTLFCMRGSTILEPAFMGRQFDVNVNIKIKKNVVNHYFGFLNKKIPSCDVRMAPVFSGRR